MKIYIFSTIIISNLFSQVDYLMQIQPIFDTNCISCHNSGGTYFGGLDLSSYSGTAYIAFRYTGSDTSNQNMTLHVENVKVFVK